MPDSTTSADVCACPISGYCDRCDLLVGLDGLHVMSVRERVGRHGREQLVDSGVGPSWAGGLPGLRGGVAIAWASGGDAGRHAVNRPPRAIAADYRHEAVYIAWQCAQQLRDAFALKDLRQGDTIAEKVLVSFPTCPIPEIARLSRTLRHWKAAFLTYFTTNRSSNGGTEAINGLIELHRRTARDFRNRDNYRLRIS